MHKKGFGAKKFFELQENLYENNLKFVREFVSELRFNENLTRKKLDF